MEFMCPSCGTRREPAIGGIGSYSEATSDGENVVLSTKVNATCQDCFRLDSFHKFIFRGYPSTLTRVCLNKHGKEVVAEGYFFNYEKRLDNRLELIVEDGKVKDKLLEELVEYYNIDVKDGDTLILVSDVEYGVIPDGYL